ncbi:PDZ domain-containing protein, partial [Enterococcus faecium]|uniref:PDZ domain-containing protein n=1 Tax=Enterococcus faecium TaxID=1352 RepID=UPI003CC564CE
AGPMNNFILALVLFIILAFMQGGVQVTNTNREGEIMPNGAAAEAGLKENDEVVRVDGKEIHSWNDLTTVITNKPGKTLDFKIEREGQVQSVDVTPK